MHYNYKLTVVAAAALAPTTIPACDGFAFPPTLKIPASRSSPIDTEEENINHHHRNPVRATDSSRARRKSFALASFDFFPPGDAFYDDDDEIDGIGIDDLYSDSNENIDLNFLDENEREEYSKIGVHHHVHWLEPAMRGVKSLGEAIADGEAVVSIPEMADFEECLDLVSEALRARQSKGSEKSARGRSRFSVSDPEAFPDPVFVESCEEILLKILDHVDEHLPSVSPTD